MLVVAILASADEQNDSKFLLTDKSTLDSGMTIKTGHKLVSVCTM